CLERLSARKPHHVPRRVQGQDLRGQRCDPDRRAAEAIDLLALQSARRPARRSGELPHGDFRSRTRAGGNEGHADASESGGRRETFRRQATRRVREELDERARRAEENGREALSANSARARPTPLVTKAFFSGSGPATRELTGTVTPVWTDVRSAAPMSLCATSRPRVGLSRG